VYEIKEYCVDHFQNSFSILIQKLNDFNANFL